VVLAADVLSGAPAQTLPEIGDGKRQCPLQQGLLGNDGLSQKQQG